MASMTAPVSKVSVNSAPGRSSPATAACSSTLPTGRAMALVSVEIMRLVPVVSEATSVATIPEYRP